MLMHCQAELSLDFFSGNERQCVIHVLTSPSGVLQIRSSGTLPTVSLARGWSTVKRVRRFVSLTGQPMSFTHDDRQLMHVQRASSGRIKVAVRWWSLIRLMLTRNWGS